MTKQEALKKVVPGTVLKGHFPLFDPISMKQLQMTIPLHLVSDCVMCSIGKQDIVDNIDAIYVPNEYNSNLICIWIRDCDKEWLD